jgi:hypothetical protein
MLQISAAKTQQNCGKASIASRRTRHSGHSPFTAVIRSWLSRTYESCTTGYRSFEAVLDFWKIYPGSVRQVMRWIVDHLHVVKKLTGGRFFADIGCAKAPSDH